MSWSAKTWNWLPSVASLNPALTAGCVCMLVAPLRCDLGCCSRTVVVLKLLRTRPLKLMSRCAIKSAVEYPQSQSVSCLPLLLKLGQCGFWSMWMLEVEGSSLHSTVLEPPDSWCRRQRHSGCQRQGVNAGAWMKWIQFFIWTLNWQQSLATRWRVALCRYPATAYIFHHGKNTSLVLLEQLFMP